jgi:hypothetical protein
VVFEINGVLLGVDVDLTVLIEGVQSEQTHLFARFLFDLRAVCRERNDFAGLLEVGGVGEVVLESDGLGVRGRVALVGVKPEGELYLLQH